jgi:hypothetical protein
MIDLSLFRCSFIIDILVNYLLHGSNCPKICELQLPEIHDAELPNILQRILKKAMNQSLQQVGLRLDLNATTQSLADLLLFIVDNKDTIKLETQLQTITITIFREGNNYTIIPYPPRFQHIDDHNDKVSHLSLEWAAKIYENIRRRIHGTGPLLRCDRITCNFR